VVICSFQVRQTLCTKIEREEKRKEKIRNEKWGGNAPEQTASFIKEQENI